MNPFKIKCKATGEEFLVIDQVIGKYLCVKQEDYTFDIKGLLNIKENYLFNGWKG